MFTSVESAYFIIWAMIIGIFAAIFISNRQRTIISKFINALFSSCAIDTESAKSFSELGITTSEENYLTKAINTQFGLRRAVSKIDCENGIKFYINESENEDLTKKYTYIKPDKKKFLYLVLLLAIIGVLCSLFTFWLSKVTIFDNEKNEIVQVDDAAQVENNAPVNNDLINDSADKESVQTSDDSNTQNKTSDDKNQNDDSLKQNTNE